MKKVLMSLIMVTGLLLTTTISGYSQVYLGAQIGPNNEMGYFYNSTQPKIHSNGKMNLFGGCMAEVDLADFLSLQAEFNYMQRGNVLTPVYKGGVPVDGTNVDVKLNYYEIPLMLKFKFGDKESQLRSYLIAGVTYGSAIEYWSYYPSGKSYDDMDVTSPTNISIDGGIGLEYQMSSQFFAFADLRYSNGMSNVIDPAKNNPLNKAGFVVTQNTGGVQMHLGVKFCISGNSQTKPEEEIKPVQPQIEEKKSEPTIVKEEKNAEPVIITLVGKIINASTKNPIEASITIDDQTENSSPVILNSKSDDGIFEKIMQPGTKCIINIQAKGFINKSETIEIPADFTDKKIEKTFELMLIEAGKIVKLENIFFDFNQAALKTESYKELNNLIQFLQNNPKVKIEISGHTDNVGTNDYNLNLSKTRAESVAEYVISKIAEASRVQYKGYGASHPLETNDTEEGRASNRRVEFKILNN
jgi:outer membrane protein OmpA-like peptidoglycan-associated protein